MKFGCDFQRLQLPEWQEAYLNYDSLKRLAKQQPRESDQSGYSEFPARLTLEIEELNQFLQLRLNFLYGWIEATLSRFSLSAISVELEDLAQVAPSELRDLGDCLRDVLAFVSKLEAFAKINSDAVQRLLSKRFPAGLREALKTLEPQGLLFARPWVNTATRLRNLLDVACRAQELHHDTGNVQSLLLQRVSPVALGCSSDMVHRCLDADDSASLMVALASPVSYLENQAMLYSVLQKAITTRGATMCITSMLEEITALLEESCGHEDVLHQLIIQFLRPQSQTSSTIDVLVGIFRELSPYQHHLLLVKDWRGRSPLHYAAEYGCAKLCKELVKFMEPIAILEADSSGLMPLHLAVCLGLEAVVKVFLRSDSVRCMISEETVGELLQMAVQARSALVLEQLLSMGKGFNRRNKLGRTPLYSAAEIGDCDLVQAILASKGADLDLTEHSYSYSPLMIACVRGHGRVVELLIQAGADPKICDQRSWSAVEHAAYRAHMTIVDLLQKSSASELNSVHCKATGAKSVARSVAPQPPTCVSTESLSRTRTETASATSIFVNLGSFDTNPSTQALDIEPGLVNLAEQHMARQMYLEISGTKCQEAPYQVSLPLVGDVSDTTWLFTTTDAENTKLHFKLFECIDDIGLSRRLLAMGTALLGHIKGWFRTGRQSLKRESTIALNTPEGGYAGSLTFTHLVCHAYKPPRAPAADQKMCLSKYTQVVGHRGLGWNMAGLGRMQIGEHTIQSLQSSLDQGADLIEFDVQVTRDHVPVIYHDWQVSESGYDLPIHAMTFKQWMAISESQMNSHHDHSRGRLPWDERARPSAPPRRTSRSLCAHPDQPRKAMAERMKHTVEYARNHNKGNIRGECIHDAYTTLRELFEKFPEDVSFDIELKYPMLWECGYWEMEPYWSCMNEYLDTTLDVIFELAGSRSIFFTCFNPEICILLSTKQKTYPVVFLNDSMVSGPAGDLRAISLQQSIRFARQWGLQGIVMAAEPFVAAPKLIGHVRDQGLVCGSYGSMNDVPEFATKQALEGIDMLIVNNVRLISNTLRSMDC